MLIFMGVGLVLWAKWLMPEERGRGRIAMTRPSTEEDKLLHRGDPCSSDSPTTGLPRRSLINAPRMLLAGGGDRDRSTGRRSSEP